MTQIPDITPPAYVTLSATAAVEALLADADRLGLTWRLRPGTVGGSGTANPESVPVVVDGDAVQARARSMTGELAAGQRVWVVQVPPAGLYVLGVLGPDRAATARVKVQRLGSQSIASGSNTPVTFTDELWDTAGFWNGSGTFTVPSGLGGLYQIECNGAFASNASGSRAINILHSGTRIASVYDDTHSGGDWRDHVSTQAELAPGDTVTMQMFQSSGGPLNIVGTASSITTFSMSLLQT